MSCPKVRSGAKQLWKVDEYIETVINYVFEIILTSGQTKGKAVESTEAVPGSFELFRTTANAI